MKLCMVAPYPRDKDTLKGGVQAVVFYLLQELTKIQDLDIHIISCDLDTATSYCETQGKMTIHRISAMKKFGNITLGYFDRRAIRVKILEIAPDIVHFQTSTLCLGSNQLNGIPVVVTIHGIKVNEIKLLRGIRNAIRFYPTLANEMRSWKSIEHLICISSHVQTMVQSFARNVKCYPIANPVSDEFFHVQSRECEDRKIILCVGFINRIKNSNGLLEALTIVKNRLNDVELVFAGDVQDQGYFQLMNKNIRENNLESNVIFKGHLNEDALLREYARCSLVVLFSDAENSPMAIQQAMAAGKAVVASRVGGVPHLVHNNETGYLVDRGDISSLAEKIVDLLQDDKKRRQFGTNAKVEALNRFQAKEVALKTYNLYKRIIDEQ